MRDFAALYAALDATNKTSEKVAALVRYFRAAPPADAAWATYFLIGRRPRQAVPVARLRAWAAEAAGIPDWLFEECYATVGDLAETIALLTGQAAAEGALTNRPLAVWIEETLLPLRAADPETQRGMVTAAWAALGVRERFVWNKLITGAFRVGVSQKLVARALAEVSGLDEPAIAHRLMGDWQPSAAFFARLIAPADADRAEPGQPYPFFLAYPLEAKLPTDARGRLLDADPADFAQTLEAALGAVSDWQAEWKWDGIRAQLIRRQGQTFIWSRGEELVTDRFPELAAIGEQLPNGSVLDGEIMPFRDGRPLPFSILQTRIGRKTLTRKVLSEAPVVLFAYDLLELEGRDVRSQPLRWRRAQLERLVAETNHPALRLSPLVQADSWEALAQCQKASRAHHAEGLMLKRLDSAYGVGRVVGDWWKWKVAPYSVDAVLIYAQAGHGRRAGLFTDYTFAVWDGDPAADGRLVPFAKAYSGLSDAEMRRVDAFIRANTLEKFGPVRAVKPQLVFELGFEGIQRSARHKSGIAVRFPRILRLREDKRIEEADTLDAIRALLPS